MQFDTDQHTFVICAYKESPFLEECIQSLFAQTRKSNVIISTSTPCAFLEKIAEKYELPVFINPVQGGIASDWNFGYTQVETPLVTLAHQDDVYAPDYLENVLREVNAAAHPLIAFTDYGEMRNSAPTYHNRLLKIKRILLSPFKIRALCKSKFVRRRSLSLGCAICAPSVTYVKAHLPPQVFTSEYRSNLDWQAWERLSKLNGEFLYCAQPLMLHRIHTDSETSQIIADNRRTIEDFEMFSKFWPKPIAYALTKVYKLSERSNLQN